MKYMKVKDLFKIIKGKKVEQVYETNENTVRLIQIDDLRNDDNIKYCERKEEYIFANKNDVIIAWDGANAGTIGYGLEGAIGSTLAILRTDSNNSNNIFIPYIGRFLQSKSKYLRDTCTGATIPHISKKALEEIKIPIPSYEKQIEISKILDKAQELIDKRKAQIEALDQLTQSVFLEMFGDPLRNNKNFEVVKLGEYTTHVSSGVTPRGGQSAYVPQGIPLIRSQNVHMNKLNLDDVVFITEEVHESMKRSQLRKYDVLLNITGASIGRVAVYLGENNQANVNQHVCIIRLTEGVNPFYLSYYVASPQFQHSIKFLNSGATREALNYTQIKNFNILLPPLELQNKFAEIVQKIEYQKDLLQKSLEELENNFNSLMQRAFKGELFND
ncbi:restriction endonuclease subunit S [Geobacillus stearothermophilus]|uniref:restriction endonuclease subunit S n=1 Tax=Geobacillus stearothermophilus TaxID=1422 RepID=UPI002E1AA93F|nr:restriction endonuclease subunit S [Geobacillus stearothermophilus]